MPTSLKVTALAVVFGLSWLAGSLVGPTPSPPPSGQSIPAGSMPGTR
ncbi:hypothetical protein [Amycolatopsis sp.]|nr:hypothetical protein [Amycolatopsis sp.]HET6708681.1 hypothetical protein [Amycolatopsis sp.]